VFQSSVGHERLFLQFFWTKHLSNPRVLRNLFSFFGGRMSMGTFPLKLTDEPKWPSMTGRKKAWKSKGPERLSKIVCRLKAQIPCTRFTQVARLQLQRASSVRQGATPCEYFMQRNSQIWLLIGAQPQRSEIHYGAFFRFRASRYNVLQ
jgi:hypothetical protein